MRTDSKLLLFSIIELIIAPIFGVVALVFSTMLGQEDGKIPFFTSRDSLVKWIKIILWVGFVLSLILFVGLMIYTSTHIR